MKNILSLCLLLVSAFCPAQNVKFSLNLVKDSTYNFNTDAALSVDQLINGTHQVLATVIKGTMAHKVIAVRDTIYDLDMRYKSLSMDISMGGKSLLSVNSTDTTKKDIFSKIITAMLDKPVMVTLGKHGNILAVGDMEAIYAGILSNFPNLTDAQKIQAKAQLQQTFSEKSIRSTFQDSFVLLPLAPVALNGSWFSNTVLESSGMMAKMRTRYTLTSVLADRYLLQGAGTVISGGESDYKKSGNLLMRIVNVKGTTSAKIEMDKKTQWIKRTEVEKNITGMVEVKDTPQTPGGLTYPMTIKAYIVTTGN